jgi:hypothetical protein
MAFVSRSERNYILDNPDHSKVGPGEYLPQDLPRIQSEAKVPFNSNTFRNHKLIKDDNPGPGTYFSKERNFSYLKHIETNKSFDNEKSLIHSLDGTLNISNDVSLLKEINKKPAFGSAIKRFYNHHTNVAETPGPGVYYKDDSFITSLNLNKLNLKALDRKNSSPKNTLSSSRISTIPSKLHVFGYNVQNGNLSVNDDPLKGFKHLGTKDDSVGPGSYDVVNPRVWVKNSLDWSKSLKVDNSESFHPISLLGNSVIMKENLDDSKNIKIGNGNQKDGKVFKPDKNNIYKYFFKKRPKQENFDMDLVEEKFYEESPGPGYYHQERPKGFYKKEKFQFFGSSSERFKDDLPNKNYPMVGPASYFIENQSKRISEDETKNKKIDKHVENEREKLPKSNSPGPGYYNIPRDIGKLYISSVNDFGSRVKRFSSLEKEKGKASITDFIHQSSPISEKSREMEKKFLKKLSKKLKQSPTKSDIKRIFDFKKHTAPPVGTYDPDIFYTVSYNVRKKVAQSDNANSPFASSINNRFDYPTDRINRNVGPGYYHREKKKSPSQSKAPFTIKDKKFPLQKVLEQPSPCDYDPINYYEWNKRSYNNLFK